MANKTSKYTLDFNPNIDGLLETSLQNIAEQVRNLPQAGDIAFLVLGGGYGRGEGGISYEEGKCCLFNDLDFFVVCKNSCPNENLAKIDADLVPISKCWTKKLGVDVDFGPATKIDKIASNLDMLMWREFALGAQICIGDKKDFEETFTKKVPANIPPHEVSKLLFNRIYGFVLAACLIAEIKKCRKQAVREDFNFIARNINKTILACGDAVLISRNLYNLHTLQKLENLKNLSEGTSQTSDKFFQELFAAYEKAVEFKTNPKVDLDIGAYEKKFSEAAAIAGNTFLHLSDYLHSHRNVPLVRILKNAVKNLTLLKTFRQLGVKNSVGEILLAPTLRGLKCEIKILENLGNFDINRKNRLTKLWQKIN